MKIFRFGIRCANFAVIVVISKLAGGWKIGALAVLVSSLSFLLGLTDADEQWKRT